MLEAAHIQDWSDDEKNRLNPRNGLAMCRLHHMAYDLGLLRVDHTGTISFRGRLSKGKPSVVKSFSLSCAGRKIARPVKRKGLLL